MIKDIQDMVLQSRALLQELKDKDFLLSGNLLSDRSLKALNNEDINHTIQISDVDIGDDLLALLSLEGTNEEPLSPLDTVKQHSFDKSPMIKSDFSNSAKLPDINDQEVPEPGMAAIDTKSSEMESRYLREQKNQSELITIKEEALEQSSAMTSEQKSQFQFGKEDLLDDDQEFLEFMMRKNTIINNVKKMVSIKYPKNIEKQR